MSHRHAAILTGLALVAAGVFCSRAALAAEPEILFDPPLRVVIRHSNGSLTRGNLTHLTKDEVTLRALSGQQVALEIGSVRSIKSADGRFLFRPDDESFDDLAGRIGKIAGTTLNGYTGSSQPNPTGTGKDDDGPDVPVQRNPSVRREGAERDEDDSSELTPPSADQPPVTAKNPFKLARTPPEAEGGETLPPAADAEAGEVLICSKCEKELPSGFRSGSACPHCGTLAFFEEEIDESAAPASDTAARTRNPFAAPAGAAPPRREQVDLPAQPAAAPAAARDAADGSGMDLASIPLIAKIGIFAGFLLAGWFFMQRH